MVCLPIVLTSTCLASALAWTSFRNNGQQFLSAGMQPEVVAKTLSTVENEWKSEATQFIRCDASDIKANSAKDCVAYAQTFEKSCSTVVSAIVQGSNGDKSVTREYMVDICSQSSITLWRRDMCTQLARDLIRHMTASTYENRISFQAKDVCDLFWSHYVAEQRVAHQAELDAIKVAEAEKQKKVVRSEVEKQKAVRSEVGKHNKSEVEKKINATIQGEWDNAIIQGDLLLWKSRKTFDGWPVPLADELFNRTATSVEMKLWDKNHSHSKLYKADLEDGRLHWSNGDVWAREAGQLTQKTKDLAAERKKEKGLVAELNNKETEEVDKYRQEAENQRVEFEAAKKEHMQKEAELEKIRENLKMDANMGKTRLKHEEEQVQAVEAAAEKKIEEATQLEEGRVMKTAYDILARADAADMPEPKIVIEKKQSLKPDSIQPVANAFPAQAPENQASKTPQTARSAEVVATKKS